MNCVIFNMIHCSMNSTFLSFVVCHYYGNTVIPGHLMAVRSLHKAVPQYVRCWLPGANQDKLGYFEVFTLFYLLRLQAQEVKEKENLRVDRETTTA